MRRARLLFVFVPLLGCKPELPSLDYLGERVRVGSDTVDQVCEGTLIRMDREVEQIEARLDLPRSDSRFEVYVVDRGTSDAYCGSADDCTVIPWRGAPFVVVDEQKFERSVAHELVHARLVASRSTPLFTEGIAQALSTPACPRPAASVDLSETLAGTRSDDLLAVRNTYYVAGELFAWLIEEFGPGQVLSLMQSVRRDSSPSTVQAKYREHFDRDLAADFLAHFRTQADLDALPPEYFGCLNPPLDVSDEPVRLAADLDCDSDRVHNNFGIDDSGYVEWTLRLDHTQTLKLGGDVPFGTSLTIEACGCIPKKGEDEYLLPHPFDVETLQPGAYRLRWIGGLDEGHSLDVELVPLDG